MRVLFVHQNFPAQYVHIAPALAARPGWEVVALTMSITPPTMPNVRMVHHAVQRGSTPGIHSYASDFEAKTLRGESAAKAALKLRTEGFSPDIICGHPGWGETLFLRDVWPDAQILSFIEFYYAAKGADVGFDPEFPAHEEDAFQLRCKNANVLMALESSDWLVSPTRWQARNVPALFQNRLSVIHDGIDTDLVRPDLDAAIEFGRDGVTMRPGDEIITFVNRNLEPYRGYHSFMRALPDILRRRPNAHVILIGGNGVSYGAAPPAGQTYREMYLREVAADLDMSRIHFVGSVPYGVYLRVLQVSAAHVYLTYPFVLSWSLLESMSAGCAVIGSATPPVEEVIRHGDTGVLVDFFSPRAIADAVVDVLARPDAYAAMRTAARNAVVREFDLRRTCLPQHLRLIEQLASGQMPGHPPTVERDVA